MPIGKNYKKPISYLFLVTLVVACKTPSRSTSRLGVRGAVQRSASHGSKDQWITPYNLVDINQSTQQPTKVPLIGDIDRITIDNPNDVFSSGMIEMSGMRVIIPANLLIDLPNKVLTLQEIFKQARPECVAKNQTGLALADSCFFESRAAIATILANRTESGAIVAGEVKIAKGNEFITGVVTYIDYNNGFFRLNGATATPANQTTGVMVRLNDPLARHSIQKGPGCGAGLNCSPDPRFSVNHNSYTASFITGYPVCIPSTALTPSRVGFAGFRAAVIGPQGGLKGDDTLCPTTNRPLNAATTDVRDSRVFAPIVLGDSVDVTGNFEKISGVFFLSANRMHVHVGLRTTPGKPDYVTLSENKWEVAGFPRQRARAAWLGFSTDPNSQLDLFRIAIDPNDGNDKTRQHEVPLASTAGNPGTFNLGVVPTINQIWGIRYTDLFLYGARGRSSPCVHLSYAGLDGGCAGGNTLDVGDNFRVISPLSRDVLARTRNKASNPSLASFDVSGKTAPNGVYQIPTEVDHPEFVELNLNQLQTPYLFTGEPWNLDHRLSAEGCGGNHGSCSTGRPLTPFPSDGGLNPMTQNIPGTNIPSDVAPRMVMSYPYTNVTDGPLLPWDVIDVPMPLAISPSSPVVLSQCVANP